MDNKTLEPLGETSIFENFKYFDKNHNEYWLARELQKILAYSEWRNFLNVIEKAITACENSGNDISNHFVDVNKTVHTGASSKDIEDIQLSRYACYLIVQNGDSRKKEIALGQTYFALQTHKQELSEKFQELSEDQKRLAVRHELKHHNKALADATAHSGVKTGLEFAQFQNFGYKGLYDNRTAADIKKLKGLSKDQDILDHMGSTELAANLFRATQTEEKLRRDKIIGKNKANQTHYDVGKKVRQTIADLGGTMPEELPTPNKSIKELEREAKKKINK
ncbi:DNA damage-inducible protein D [uncultured Phascolarctobacterium sp.]|uniref:DNA damage-inducible protein D n=1 Tax=uncultured Phascolarctobacterium sp. TaxID=512296 RepID=UPI0027D9BCB5|nr:DNA damage-inducible protein D [uncultured Phascolarctobacterium sp.]